MGKDNDWGVFSPKIFKEEFCLTTSLSAAIMPSPPWSHTGSRPSRDRSIFTAIRSGLGSSYMSASPDHSRRKSRPEFPDCSIILGFEVDALRVRGILNTDLDKSHRFGVPLHGCVGGSQEVGGTVSGLGQEVTTPIPVPLWDPGELSNADMFTRFVFFKFLRSHFQTRGLFKLGLM